VPAEEVEKRQWGWILNVRGLSPSDAAGSSDEAIERFLSDAADRPGTRGGLESTALQNLGVMEVMSGRNDSARGFIKESVDLRLGIGESFRGRHCMAATPYRRRCVS
jgi:hypothetical protein